MKEERVDYRSDSQKVLFPLGGRRGARYMRADCAWILIFNDFLERKSRQHYIFRVGAGYATGGAADINVPAG